MYNDTSSANLRTFENFSFTWFQLTAALMRITNGYFAETIFHSLRSSWTKIVVIRILFSLACESTSYTVFIFQNLHNRTKRYFSCGFYERILSIHTLLVGEQSSIPPLTREIDAWVSEVFFQGGPTGELSRRGQRLFSSGGQQW